MSQKIEVDTRTFIRFWLVLLGFFLVGLFLMKAWTGLIVVGAAAFLAIAIRPLGEKINKLFKRRGKPGKETLSNVLAFLLVFFVILIAVAVIGPVVFKETSKLTVQIPVMFENFLGGWEGINTFGSSIGIENLANEISGAFSNFASSILVNLGSAVGTVGNVFSAFFMTIVLTIFFLLEGQKLYRMLWSKLQSKENKKATIIRGLLSKMANVVAKFVSNQVVIAVIDGATVSVIVAVLSLVFGFSTGLALPMGMISMIFYLIPMFGQFISCIIISLILFLSNPISGIIYLALYLIFSQIEGNFIAPRLQGGSLNLSPLIILVAIVIGMYSFGLIGAIVAIPIAGCIKVIIDEYPKIKDLKN